MDKQEKMLEKIAEQNHKIIDFMVKQNQDINGLKDTVNTRFDRLESAVLENSNNINDVKTTVNNIDKKVDTAVTNHEGRIRKLETKVGI